MSDWKNVEQTVAKQLFYIFIASRYGEPFYNETGMYYISRFNKLWYHFKTGNNIDKMAYFVNRYIYMRVCVF